MRPQGKVRVLHVIGQLSAGGLERQLCGLLSSLDVARFESEVVTFAEGGRFSSPIAALGVPVTVLPGRAFDRARRLTAHVRRGRPDLVYAWGAAAMAYGRAAGALLRVRVVTHDGSTAALPLELRTRACNLLLLPFTSALVCNSERRGEELRRLPIHRSRVAVVANGVEVPERTAGEADAARLRAELALPPGPIVGSVGRLDRLKNQRAILDAARLLAGRGVSVSAVLVGQGPETGALLAHAERLGLASRVRLVGEQADVGPYLRGFSAFAFPSLIEGMPNALQEALACGLPAVASDVGDVRRLLDDGACGIVIPPGDAEALCEGLGRVLADRALAERFAELGRRRMRECFSMAGAARRTEAVFRRVLKSAPVPFLPLRPDPEATPCAS
jgi:glycosyltransferase involved in cell wall biosynthesis